MAYKHQKRIRQKKFNYAWLMPSLIILLGIWLLVASLVGKSPTEVTSDVYYWIVGDPSPHESKSALKSIITSKNSEIDSLSNLISEIQNKNPYRTGIVKTSANSLNLRAEPFLTAEVVIKIPDSSSVQILYFDEEVLVLDGEPGKWCKIKYADKEGWVWGNYLQLLEN